MHLASQRKKMEKVQQRFEQMTGTESHAKKNPWQTKRILKKWISVDSEKSKPHWPNCLKGHKGARVNKELIRCRQKTLMYGNMGADDSSMAQSTITVRLPQWTCVCEMDHGALGLPAP